MRLEIFVGLTDRNGEPFDWKEIYPVFSRKISKVGFATIFNNLEGIYRNQDDKLILEESKMILMMLEEEEKLEEIKEVLRWFLKETDQESALIVKDLTDFEYVE